MIQLGLATIKLCALRFVEKTEHIIDIRLRTRILLKISGQEIDNFQKEVPVNGKWSVV